ncbi:MAG TPA: response regulator transcription factor [Blastocatellia bacterium]|nr:response regulator transcription factor [Blastocatellia bacterium]
MRILLVEDEERVLSFVAKGLTAEQFAVDTAVDGCEGLTLAETYKYDLMILDLMLPGVSGSEILRKVRAKDKKVPILILTARDFIADKVKNLDSGADDYLTKPFVFAELLSRVKALIRRSSISQSNTLRVGDLEMDQISQQVRRSGRRIDLTAKEYALLQYMMANAGRVISRTMMVEHVWDQSFDGATNIVDVYVRYLRNKVDGPFEKKLIRTIRGFGYSISEEDEQ